MCRLSRFYLFQDRSQVKEDNWFRDDEDEYRHKRKDDPNVEKMLVERIFSLISIIILVTFYLVMLRYQVACVLVRKRLVRFVQNNF